MRTLLTGSLALALVACGSSDNDRHASPEPAPDPSPEPAETPPEATDRGAPSSDAMDVTTWQALLDDFATDDGEFRYAALRGDAARRAQLDAVASAIGSADVSGYSRDAKLAFYINAYNVLTVKAVVDAWPIESVMGVDGFFDEATHRVTGEEMTLNHLENEIIRSEQFAEPRIHFAVNCASAGCPRLSRTAYTPDNLEAQLTERARSFVRRTTRLEGGRALTSQIFEWFAADFEPAGGVRAFVASQLEPERAARVRDEGTTIAHFDYDWAVNAAE